VGAASSEPRRPAGAEICITRDRRGLRWSHAAQRKRSLRASRCVSMRQHRTLTTLAPVQSGTQRPLLSQRREHSPRRTEAGTRNGTRPGRRSSSTFTHESAEGRDKPVVRQIIIHACFRTSRPIRRRRSNRIRRSDRNTLEVWIDQQMQLTQRPSRRRRLSGYAAWRS
jgi:hypothetical protein